MLNDGSERDRKGAHVGVLSVVSALRVLSSKVDASL